MSCQISWTAKLDHLIQQKQMLSTPFYQAWSSGKLSKSTLQEYAREYYHHVKAFPTYLSALHSRSQDPNVRLHLLNNLIDEEAGEPNHPQLWRSFALALGVTEEQLETQKPSPATQELVDAFQHSCRKAPLVVGLAALYCYESQIPAICPTKIEGLKNWYGLTDPEDYRYFSVHEVADVEHSRIEKELLEKMVTPQEEKAVLKGAESILNVLWNFLGSFEMQPAACM